MYKKNTFFNRFLNFNFFNLSNLFISRILILGVAFVFLFLSNKSIAFSKFDSSTRDEKVAQISEEKAQEKIKIIRNLKIANSFAFEFKLENMPRNSDGKIYSGLIFSDEKNAAFRNYKMYFGNDNASFSNDYFSIILSKTNLYNNQSRLFYASKKNGSWQKIVESQDIFAPILPELIYSPFDLYMPFLKWQASYIKSEKIGRPVNLFKLTPPDEFKIKYPNISYVELAISQTFNAIIRVRVFGENNTLLRQTNMLKFKKISDYWIIESFEVLDNLTKNKDRIDIIKAKMNINFDLIDESLFDDKKDFFYKNPPQLNLERL